MPQVQISNKIQNILTVKFSEKSSENQKQISIKNTSSQKLILENSIEQKS